MHASAYFCSILPYTIPLFHLHTQKNVRSITSVHALVEVFSFIVFTFDVVPDTNLVSLLSILKQIRANIEV